MNGEWIQGEPASHKGAYYLALLRRYYGGGRDIILIGNDGDGAHSWPLDFGWLGCLWACW